MTRLDQLAKPKRRNGEHISAILERERRQALELENMQKASLAGQDKRKSRSMSQLGGKSREGSSQDRFKSTPLQKHYKNGDATRSMSQLTNGAKKSPAKTGWDLKLSLSEGRQSLGSRTAFSTTALLITLVGKRAEKFSRKTHYSL